MTRNRFMRRRGAARRRRLRSDWTWAKPIIAAPLETTPAMNAPTRKDETRVIRAPRGTERSCRSWLTEAAYRMLQNNLDPEVAENPAELVVYGGIGRAARDWPSFDTILESLRTLEDDQILLIQSGKPVGVFRTHADE